MPGREPRLRVLWAIKGLGAGGAERLLVSMAKTVDRSRFDVDVARVLSWKDAFVAPLEAEGVTVHDLGARALRDVGWVPRLRRLVADRGYDVVHFHSPAVGAAGRVALARRRDVALVATDHNAWGSYGILTRLSNALTLPLGAAHVVVSDDARRSVWAPLRGRAETLVHGIPLDELRAARTSRRETRRALGIAEEELVAVTVGNFRPQKAYPDLLAAARLWRDAGLPLRLLVVGQGPQAAEVRALHGALGLDGAVDILGFRDDVPAVLAAADLFVLASRWEGYPVAVMEAMAAGLPVVATAVGGVPDAVRDGVDGILVPAADPPALAAAVGSLASDRERRLAMGERAAAAAARFDIRLAMRRMEDIYEAVAPARPAPR